MVIHRSISPSGILARFFLVTQFCIGALAANVPVITAQPQPQTAFVGANVNLRVAAVSSDALRYRWRFNGTNLPITFPGQSTPLLMITNARLTSAGPYSVVVSNSCGAVTGETAVVTINSANPFGGGYVNLFAPPGLSFFTIALGQYLTNQTVDQRLAYVPEGSSVFKIDGTGFIANNFLDGWSMPEMLLTLGEGWIFNNPTTNAFTLTVIGGAEGGSLTNELPAGYSFCASLLPQAGSLGTVLGFPVTPGVEVIRLDKYLRSFEHYSVIEHEWNPAEPLIAVGESFFVHEPEPRDWIRQFQGDPPVPLTLGIRVVHPALVSEIPEINFFTYHPDFGFGRVVDLDNTTPVTNNFLGQLYAAASNIEDALHPIGRPVPFLNAAGAGYIRSSTIKLPGLTSGQTVFIQLRAWEKCAGDTYEQAVNNGGAAGRSTIVSVVSHASLENGVPGLPPPNANSFPAFQVALGPELPLRVARIQSVGAHVEICFATRPGAVYCLEKTASAALPVNWTPFSGAEAIVGTGHVATLTANAGGQQTFYRVRRIQ